MEDPNFGMVLEDPEQEGVPFMPSFTPTQQWGEQGPPAESDSDYNKRMAELEHAGFAKGFAMGLGYGGYDMVTSTGKAIWGAAKFVGRAHLQVGLRFKWVGQWMTGSDTTRTEEMLVAVDAKQQEVIDQGLQVGKFLGTLLLDTALVLPKIEVGLLTGDLEMVQTALHGSETHRKIFEMVSEVLAQTTEDLTGENRTPGQKGYVIGKIVFEVASFLLPFTKAGTLMQVTKSQVLTKLIGKAGLLRPGAQQVATAVKVAVDASQMCFVAGTPVLTKSGWLRIEDIRPGMWVWSRDENTGASCWKRVRYTFITHPTELYRLTYGLRGPPGSAVKADIPVRLATTENLGVTAPHPFWVCNREQPGFVMAEELREGDELLTADGRRAVVCGKVLEAAPAGETFTTYNFEVEDYHTYFAGRSAVWVHNLSRAPCEKALSIYRRLRVQVQDPFNAFIALINKVPDAPSQTFFWAAAECMKEILQTGGKFPSYRDMKGSLKGHYTSWKSLDLQQKQAFMDRIGTVSHEVARGQWIQIALEVHHGVPRSVSEFLGIPKGRWNDTPAFLTTMLDHRVGLDSLHGAMRARGIDLGNLAANPQFIGPGGKAALARELIAAYGDAGIADFGNQCKQFLAQFGY